MIGNGGNTVKLTILIDKNVFSLSLKCKDCCTKTYVLPCLLATHLIDSSLTA